MWWKITNLLGWGAGRGRVRLSKKVSTKWKMLIDFKSFSSSIFLNSQASFWVLSFAETSLLTMMSFGFSIYSDPISIWSLLQTYPKYSIRVDYSLCLFGLILQTSTLEIMQLTKRFYGLICPPQSKYTMLFCSPTSRGGKLVVIGEGEDLHMERPSGGLWWDKIQSSKKLLPILLAPMKLMLITFDFGTFCIKFPNVLLTFIRLLRSSLTTSTHILYILLFDF